MFWPFRRRQLPPQDTRLTESQLAEMEVVLRHQVQALVRKVWFVDREAGGFFAPEDKVALSNEGIDALVKDFRDYMVTKVRPDDET